MDFSGKGSKQNNNFYGNISIVRFTLYGKNSIFIEGQGEKMIMTPPIWRWALSPFSNPTGAASKLKRIGFFSREAKLPEGFEGSRI